MLAARHELVHAARTRGATPCVRGAHLTPSPQLRHKPRGRPEVRRGAALPSSQPRVAAPRPPSARVHHRLRAARLRAARQLQASRRLVRVRPGATCVGSASGSCESRRTRPLSPDPESGSGPCVSRGCPAGLQGGESGGGGVGGEGGASGSGPAGRGARRGCVRELSTFRPNGV